MTVSWVLPLVLGRDTKQTKRAGRQKKESANKIYDHFEMLQDRIRGMKWDDIAKKHGYKGTGSRLCGLCLRSNAMKKMTPEEIGKIRWPKNAIK